MEAVPRLSMISCELKVSPSNTDFGTSLLKYIKEHYHEDPESYKKEIKELETLRQTACKPPRDYTGCRILKRYYSQLHFLQSRFPMTDDGAASVCFTWTDIYSQMVFTITDINYEQACILYNIGALHSELGAMDSRANTEGMKIACTHFQCAAWAFEQLRDMYPQPKGSDMSHDLLTFFINVMLAQAQECILEKSMLDSRKSSITAKVAAQIVEYYRCALGVLVSGSPSSDAGCITDVVGGKKFQEWKKFIEFKMAYYKSISRLYMGNQAEEQQKFGERVAWYQSASEALNEAIKIAKALERSELNEALTFTMDVIGGKHNNSKKENDFVYHEKVPAVENLPDVLRASLVKGIPFSHTDPEVCGQDIFARLVPMEAHESASLYSEEKAKILRSVGAKIEDKNQELMAYRSSLQVDKNDLNFSLEPEVLPQELIERCAAMSVRPTAVEDLNAVMKELMDTSMNVESTLKRCSSLLLEEEIKEIKHQEMCGSRLPSLIIIELNKECAKYDEARWKAVEPNQKLQSAIDEHAHSLRLLTLPLEDIEKILPSVSSLKSAPVHEKATRELQQLLDKVDEMQQQRSSLEQQLREALQKDDITEILITHTQNKKENLKKTFEEELKKHDQLLLYLDQNLTAQDNILCALTQANAQYAETRRAVIETKKQREAMINSIITAFDAYEDIKDKAEKGLEFYQKLNLSATRLLNRIRSVTHVQQDERNQIIDTLEKSGGRRDRLGLMKTLQAPGTGAVSPKLSDYLMSSKLPLTQKTPGGTPYSLIPPDQLLKQMFYSSSSSDSDEQNNVSSSETESTPDINYGSDIKPTNNEFSATSSRPPPVGSEATTVPEMCSGVTSVVHSSVGVSVPSQNQYWKSAVPSYSKPASIYSCGPYSVAGSAQQVSSKFGIISQGFHSASAPAGHMPVHVTVPSQMSATVMNPIVTAASNQVPFVCDSYHIPPSSYAAKFCCSPVSLSYIYSSCSSGSSSGYPQSSSSYAVSSSSYPSSFSSYPLSSTSYSTRQSSSPYSPSSATYYPPSLTSYSPSVSSCYSPSLSSCYSPSVSSCYSPSVSSCYSPSVSSCFSPSISPSYSSPVPSPSVCGVPYVPVNTGRAMFCSGYSAAAPYLASGISGIYNTVLTYTSSSPTSQREDRSNPYSFYNKSAPPKLSHETSVASWSHMFPYGDASKAMPLSAPPASFPQTVQQQAESCSPCVQTGEFSSVSGQQIYAMPWDHTTQNMSYPVLPPSPAVSQVPLGVTPVAEKTFKQLNENTGATSFVQESAPATVPTEMGAVLLKPPGQLNLGMPTETGAVLPEATGKLHVETIRNVCGKSTAPVDRLSSSSTDLICGIVEAIPPQMDPKVLEPKVADVVDTRLKISEVKDKSGPPKDPLDDPAVREKFTSDVEKYEKFVDGLVRKSLNGTTPLDQKWKEFTDAQDKESRKMSISIARCYPMKNRYPDIMPYDNNRVKLSTMKDDYINASYLKGLFPSSPLFVNTQAPLPATYIDFWAMIWEQQVETLVCLLSCSELKSHFYWPKERGQSMQFGLLTVTLQNQLEKVCSMEYRISLTHSENRISRVVILLQFTAWPSSGIPSSPSLFLQFVTEVLNYHKQQRSLQRPVIVHCSAGVGRSGIFCLVSAIVTDLHTGHGPTDVLQVAARMSQQRKFLIQEKDQLKFCYDAVLYYAQDLLMKRGILTNRASFEDKLPGSCGTTSHSRHPSEDFILGSGGLAKLQSGMAKMGLSDQQNSSTPACDSCPPSKEQNVQQADVLLLSKTGDSTGTGNCAKLATDNISVDISEVGSKTSDHEHSEIGDEPSVTSDTPNPSITSILDPSNFTLEPTSSSPVKRRITKESFINPSSNLANPTPDSADPLSQLDPLWSLKRNNT